MCHLSLGRSKRLTQLNKYNFALIRSVFKRKGSQRKAQRGGRVWLQEFYYEFSQIKST